LVISPWVTRNLVTFDRPIFLASNLDSVIAGANCHDAYYGRAVGSWIGGCNIGNLPKGDESVQGATLRERGLNYAHSHTTRLPLVVAARVGRAWDVFNPLQGIADTRSTWTRRFAVFAFYAVLILAVLGAVQLRRQSVSLVPFLAQAALVTVTAAVGYGLWRLRLPLDVAAIALAGVAMAESSRHLLLAMSDRGLPQHPDRAGKQAQRAPGSVEVGNRRQPLVENRQ
jgi:hypothetical protein